jgi:hypothetical protein
MSHFSKITTQITDRDCLVRALADLGFGEGKVEVNEVAQHLYGYRGDKRPQKAEVILRRKYVGRASNDIGFALSAQTGTYEAIISEFDEQSNGYNQKWLSKLTQRYSYHLVMKQAELAGYSLVEQTDEQGEIHLTLQPAVAATVGGF